jgi:hypothetical protein
MIVQDSNRVGVQGSRCQAMSNEHPVYTALLAGFQIVILLLLLKNSLFNFLKISLQETAQKNASDQSINYLKNTKFYD